MIKVRATREGLVGSITASGWQIDRLIPFVALPSVKALWKFVRIRNPRNDLECMAMVLDIGPWNTHDDDYVFKGERPQAESGTDMMGRKTNGAGIDLGEKVWKSLQMFDNSDVEWQFIEASGLVGRKSN
jgi:hypothetical protein